MPKVKSLGTVHETFLFHHRWGFTLLSFKVEKHTHTHTHSIKAVYVTRVIFHIF